MQLSNDIVVRRALRSAARPQRVRQVQQWFTILLIVVPMLLPPVLVVWELVTPTATIWQHLWATLLPDMLRNTLLLILAVGSGTLVLGAGLAWLVCAYHFPGRRVFEWLLLLPLAMPAYVLAFVFVATFDFAGPVQSLLRSWFGPGLPFPQVRSGAGAALVLTLTLYPYVYLLARTAFRDQSATIVEAARAMGYGRTHTFLRLVLPLARPALVAGVTLAMLETLTDFATVRFFNLPTLSEGVFRVWEGMMNRQAAAELAALLLGFALLAVALERQLRGNARYYQTARPPRPLLPVRLHGWRAGLACGVCAMVLAVAFVLPVLQLLFWAITEIRRGAPGALDDLYANYVGTTLGLAATAAALSIGIALALAHVVRLSRGKLLRPLARLATLGYTMPGAVVAVGVLLALAATDRAVNGLAQQWWGLNPGLLLTGSAMGLIYAYLVRFMALAYNSVEANLERVTPNMAEAARCLGSTQTGVMWRIHAPLARGGMATGALLVFVDVMKELPATLLLRPFGMDTLAIWTYMLAAESFWHAAAVPALTILLVGLVPVVLLLRAGHKSH